jgi:transcriptional regulator with XRE-family HTH domain
MSSSINTEAVVPTAMSPDEKAFFQALGVRIATTRKGLGMTQVQLAEELGIAQQVVASYEVGRRRMPIALLPRLARALAVTVEELIGEETRPGKRGPAPKLLQRMERIRRLPRTKQRFVMDMIDTVLQQATRERQQAQQPRDGDEAASRQRRAVG